MADTRRKLARAAKQLLDTDLALGGQMLPAGRKPPIDDAAPSLESNQPILAENVLDTADQKAGALEAIDVAEVRGCTKCRLSETRRNTVFGEGSPGAELVFVGEGPGEDEDATGRPFVGRAGEKLNEMIRAMGLKREDVYIANVVKCRPPGNRTPAPDEADACWSYLVRQLQIIRPKAIVTLGNPATQKLLNTSIGITKLRGQWQKLPPIAPGLAGIPVMPTFHPSYVLRQYTPDVRGKVWSDLQQVMVLLGLPTSK